MNGKTKSTLVDITYQQIKNDINQHLLIPGQKIKPKELSERYSVSETPVKQALMRLVSEGLVESSPRKGMKIKSIRWDDLEEIFDIRLMMELYYMKDIIAAVKYNPALKTALEANVSQNLELLSEVTHLDVHSKNYDMDHQFHELYLMCSGNKTAVRVYRNLNSHAYSNYIYGRQPKEKTIAGVSEHRKILDAILAQDESALGDAIRLHIHNAKEILKLLLKVDRLTLDIYEN